MSPAGGLAGGDRGGDRCGEQEWHVRLAPKVAEERTVPGGLQGGVVCRSPLGPSMPLTGVREEERRRCLERGLATTGSHHIVMLVPLQ